MDVHQRNKDLIGEYRAALYDCEASALHKKLHNVFAPDCEIHLAHPFEDLDGPDALLEVAFQPLLEAVPDLERRDFIVMSGDCRGSDWVGCGGHYMGIFERPWLDIPATRHAMFMRYAEFFRVEDDKVVEMQALWDIPQVMMQADAWPMTPSLGVEWLVPGPATQDGIIDGPYDPERSEASKKLVLDMATSLQRSPEGVEAMQLDHYWHPQMMWYGPAGIGSMRRISGFRNWHQAPFLKAMPDRRAFLDKGVFFGDGDYVGFTGWPSGIATLTGDGWLGLAPAGQEFTRRSLDFWRCENGMIRENWVLVDLLHIYDQLGVDVFARMREISYARQSST